MGITNLINNALEAITSDGYVNISLLKEEDKMVVTISNPYNSDPALIKKIEEIGFSMKKGSSGLGVPITKKIIEKHKGEFYIKLVDAEIQVTIIMPI